MILIIKKDETVSNDWLVKKSILLLLLKVFAKKNIAYIRENSKFKMCNSISRKM